VQAPVDVVVQAVGSAPAPTITNGVEQGPRGCTLRLVARPIEKSSSGCYLDEHISDGPGLLHFPCSGDGEAEAVFGEHHYVGRVEHGDVQVEIATELDWEDGCRWGTLATISGSVVGTSGLKDKTQLAWRYLDHVITGANCSGVCRAKAAIDASGPSSSNRGPALPGDDEDDSD
jgi:hypothetical protein